MPEGQVEHTTDVQKEHFVKLLARFMRYLGELSKLTKSFRIRFFIRCRVIYIVKYSMLHS